MYFDLETSYYQKTHENFAISDIKVNDVVYIVCSGFIYPTIIKYLSYKTTIDKKNTLSYFLGYSLDNSFERRNFYIGQHSSKRCAYFVTKNDAINFAKKYFSERIIKEKESINESLDKIDWYYGRLISLSENDETK
jgi:hypothetical protein